MAEVVAQPSTTPQQQQQQQQPTGSTATTNATATATAVSIPKKWRCDICQNCWFDDFHDAVEHENNCKPPLVTQNSLDNAAVTSTSSSKSKKISSSPVITPTTTPTRRDNNINNNNNNNNDKNNSLIKSIEEIKKSLSKKVAILQSPTQTLSDTDVQYINAILDRLDSFGDTITYDILSKTLIGTVVSKLKKHDSILGPKAKALVKKWKAIASAATSSASSASSASKSTSSTVASGTTAKKNSTSSSTMPKKKSAAAKSKSMHKKKEQQQSAVKLKPHSFFAPRTSKENQTNTPVVATATTTTTTKSLKRKLPSSSSSSGDAINVDVDNDDDRIDDPIDEDADADAEKESSTTAIAEAVTATATLNSKMMKKLKTTTKTPTTVEKGLKSVIAPLFQGKTSKQILAEQRSAELAAKQELERRKEQQRQLKRAELFHNKNKNKGEPSLSLSLSKGLSSSSSSGNNKVNDNNNNNNNGIARKLLLLPMAPKFPIPNHIINNNNDDDDDDDNTLPSSDSTTDLILLPTNHPFRRRSTKKSTTTTTTICTTTITINNNESMIKEGTSTSTSSSWLSSPSALDTIVDDASYYTSIQRAMHDTFMIPPPSQQRQEAQAQAQARSGDDIGVDTAVLWNDKYGMEQQGLVGTNAEETFHKLVECIDQWRISRKDALERMANRHRKLQAKHRRDMMNGSTSSGSNSKGKNNTKKGGKATTTKKKKRKYDYYDDDDDWLVGDDINEDNDQMTNLYLLTGPSSSGKTSMVHHVAKHCGNCKVLEINTTQARSGLALKNAIEEATQSYSSSFDVQQQQAKAKEKSTNNNNDVATAAAANGFFGKPTNKKSKTNKSQKRNTTLDSDDESYESDSDGEDNEEKNEKNKSAVTIVLIDEVDILFESNGDAGFWSALGSLAKSTKCPIILTANSCPPQLDNNNNKGGNTLKRAGLPPCRHFQLERPSPMECSTKLLQICRNESNDVIQFRPDLRAKGSDAIQQQLSRIAISCNCDLRKIIQELRVFASASTASLAGRRAGAITSAAGDNGVLPKEKEEPAGKGTLIAVPPNKDSGWRPTVHSLVPSTIPMDKYSIITIKGMHFDAFRSVVDSEMNEEQIAVQIGSHVCRNHIVDDETMLILCPPYLLEEEEKHCITFCSRLTKRILPLSIDCPSLGLCGGDGTPSRIVMPDELVDGNHVNGTHWLTVEYAFPEEIPNKKTKDNTTTTATTDTTSDAEDDDVEFELDENKKNSNNTSKDEAIKAARMIDNIEGEEAGLLFWKNAISTTTAQDEKETSMLQKKKKTTSPLDLDIAAQLELLSKNAHNASDASFLEDFGDGLPYLSGACKGFAFDYTEDCIGSRTTGGVDTLRMHEKSRPPREDKLFELGWNDNCYFHGNADTYMTLPSVSQRRDANIFMNHFRGDEASAGQLAITTATTTAVVGGAVSPSFDDETNNFSREDFDWYANQESCAASSDEDSYLPQYIPPLIKNLPNILRNATGGISISSIYDDDMERQKEECYNRLITQVTDYILPTTWNDLARWSYGKFGFNYNQRDRTNLVLECMPFLRRIGILEKATEFADLKATENEEETSTTRRTSTRRTTRRQAKARRHHYLDKLSLTLRRDEADLNSSDVGTLFANDSIMYSNSNSNK